MICEYRRGAAALRPPRKPHAHWHGAVIIVLERSLSIVTASGRVTDPPLRRLANLFIAVFVGVHPLVNPPRNVRFGRNAVRPRTQ